MFWASFCVLCAAVISGHQSRPSFGRKLQLSLGCVLKTQTSLSGKSCVLGPVETKHTDLRARSCVHMEENKTNGKWREGTQAERLFSLDGCNAQPASCPVWLCGDEYFHAGSLSESALCPGCRAWVATWPPTSKCSRVCFPLPDRHHVLLHSIRCKLRSNSPGTIPPPPPPLKHPGLYEPSPGALKAHCVPDHLIFRRKVAGQSAPRGPKWGRGACDDEDNDGSNHLNGQPWQGPSARWEAEARGLFHTE